MSIKLSPSMLSIDFGKVAEQLKIVEDAGTQYIHLDVMDGIFVPSISFGMPVLQSIKPITKIVCDAHLMVQEPIRYVEAFAKAADGKATKIIIPSEIQNLSGLVTSVQELMDK